MAPSREEISRALYPLDAVGRLPVWGDGTDGGYCRASVLVPLEHTPEGYRVLLTVRTGHLKTHAGQVSFPGGSEEAGDDGPVETALRETSEETGIRPEFVEVAGLLARYRTITGFLMTPVVGFIRPGYELRRQPEEVADLFWMPLEQAIDQSAYQRRSLMYRGKIRHFHAQEYRGRVVWGATAAILLRLGHMLRNS